MGKPSEILVVSDSLTWQSRVGDTIRSIFMDPQDGFPDSEANFSLLHINRSDFDKASHLHHNILIIEVDTAIVKSNIETLKDEWAQPQRVVKIESASDTALINIIAKQGAAIKELFEQNERAIARIKNAIERNQEAEEFLNRELGIIMVITDQLQLTGKTYNSVCLESKGVSNRLKLIIHTFPYKDSSQLRADSLLTFRIKHLQCNSTVIQADVNSPKTLDFTSYEGRKFIFKGLYAIETRGLYKPEGKEVDIPYVSYAIIDAPRQRVVVFDGYVNNTEISKRGSIRQLESLILESEFTFPKAIRK
ncbi:MAG: DUF4837 family protein [Bacteroidales bacterium]